MHALILERVEGDARAQYVVAGVACAEGLEQYAPEQARVRVDGLLTSAATATGRRAGISDEEWELRVALGVTGVR